jgi:hypothetical protein
MESLFNRSGPVPDGDVLRPDVPETDAIGFVDGEVPDENQGRGAGDRYYEDYGYSGLIEGGL